MAGNLIHPDDAWGFLADTIEPLAPVTRQLGGALGGWLAVPVAADRDIPVADRSAMDGFAVRSVDLAAAPVGLVVTGEVAAGSPDDPPLATGECVRIFTGANVPLHADAVVAVESTSSGSFREHPDDPAIEVFEAVVPGRHIFRAGEVARAGAVMLDRGTRLGSRQVAVAAAAGCAEVVVHRSPRIVVLNTGEELLDAGVPAASHQTRNSNGPFLEAALHAAGFAEVSRRTVPDSKRETTEVLRRALEEADAVIVTGGISAGRYDHVSAALVAAGARIDVRGVAIKPGKPQVFARSPSGALTFGLPGNPLSSLVGFYEFVLPALRRMAGCPAESCRPAWTLPLSETVRHDGDRMLILPAVLERAEKGLQAVPRRPTGSADLLTGGLVDGAVHIPASAGRVTPGTLVTFRPWTEGWSS